jgi:replicative DNA helicase
VPGGFPLWFTTLLKSDPTETPGFDPDREPLILEADLPTNTINQEVKKYQDSLTDQIVGRFKDATISRSVLEEMSVGYNGRYIVYPYFQEDGNCYTARCVFPNRIKRQL